MTNTDGSASDGAVICDLDGVVWLADHAIAGAAQAVERLRRAGRRVLFVTNNSYVPVADVEAKLARFGIPAVGDVITSARAGASLVEAGQRVLLLGGPGAREELVARGAIVVQRTDEPVDVVVVGFHRDFDYEEMRLGVGAVRRGARLVATNDDATYPTPDGPIPGCGAILAGVVVASGVLPAIAGKPYDAMAAIVRAELGGHVANAVMVGDRPDTDGRFARAIGCHFALVLSGVTTERDLPVDPSPDLVAADLGAIADALLQPA
jgi:HAD superfamily hydrolase (TIGR01450 family)